MHIDFFTMKKLSNLLYVGFALFFLCQNRVVLSQNAYVDSLKLEVRHAASDSTKILLLRKIAWYYLTRDLDLAREYTDQAYAISTERGYEFQMASCRHYYGLIHRLEGDYSAAIPHFTYALDFYLAEGMEESATGPLFNLAVVYSFIGDWEKSLEYYYRELAINEKYENRRGVGNTLNSIGLVHKKMGEYQKAREKFLSSLEIFEAEADSNNLPNVLTSLAQLESDLENWHEAEAYALRSLAIDRVQQNKWGLAYDYELLAGVAQGQGAIQKALGYARQGLTYAEDQGLKRNAALGHLLLARLFHALGDRSQAQTEADISLVMAKEVQDADLLKDLYDFRGEFWAEGGNFEEAYASVRESLSLRDTIFDKEKLKLTQELNAKYELNQKEQALANLQKENELRELAYQRQRRLNISLIGIVVLLVLLFSSAIWGLRTKWRADQKIALQQGEIQRQKIAELEKQHEVMSLHAMLNGEEAERKRIAKDLHDGLGGLLASIKHHLQVIPVPQRPAPVAKTLDMIDGAYEEVRRISHNMMPYALSKLGLVHAIEDLARDMEASQHIETHVQTFGLQGRLPESLELMLYRITQELLNNISKHAQADKVLIEISRFDGKLHLTVEDNGIGFTQAGKAASQGLGLRSIHSRVEYLNGDLEVESTLGEGTTVSIHVPLTESIPVT